MTLSGGTRIGSYEVIALLGSGGMGEVYRARDARLKRDVALKILPDAFAEDPGRLARFQREAESSREIYVRPFPGRSGKWLISNRGGQLPQWRADGKELFYLGGDFNTRSVMAVTLSLSETTLTKSEPHVLFFGGRVQWAASDRYVVSRDGQRFLLHRATAELEEAAENPVTFVLNWTRGVDSK